MTWLLSAGAIISEVAEAPRVGRGLAINLVMLL